MDNTLNQKAIELLGEHDYPKSKEEALQLKALLAKALEAAEDPNEPVFKEKYDELNEIVNWSLTRHKTWKWPVIAGVALFAALLCYGFYSKLQDIKENKEKLQVVKAWTDTRDTTITWEECPETINIYDNNYYENAAHWKAYQLIRRKSSYTTHSNWAANYRAQADSASSKKSRKNLLENEKKYAKEAAENRKEFDELAPLKFDDVQKHAVKTIKSWASHSRSTAIFYTICILLVLILIGLYIWTGNPYGYDITKSRTRHKILDWISKWGLRLATLCLGTGIAAQLFADDKIVEYVYNSGRRETRREADVAGTAMNVMWKIFLIVIGAILLVGVSGLVMLLETAFGLPTKLREVKQG